MKINKIIFEEIEKFKLFSKYDSSKTLSEQTNNVGADVGEIMRELSNFNSNEQKIVDIVSKYKTNADMKNFLDQYKSISGKDFGLAIPGTINVNQDKKEFNQLVSHLKTIGYDLKTSYDKRGGTVYTISSTGAAGASASQDPQARQKHINSIFCTVKDGIINNPSSHWNGKRWSEYIISSKATFPELKLAQESCPEQKIDMKYYREPEAQKVGGSKTRGSNVNQRFIKSISSAGIEGSKMDVATLQKISDLLEKGVTSTNTGGTNVTNEVPSIAQLTSIVDKLNQA